MSYEARMNAISALVTAQWISKTAAQYFDNVDKLQPEDLIALRAHFISDVTRQVFKPDLDNLEKGCTVYLKMRCGKFIQEKIATNSGAVKKSKKSKNG